MIHDFRMCIELHGERLTLSLSLCLARALFLSAKLVVCCNVGRTRYRKRFGVKRRNENRKIITLIPWCIYKGMFLAQLSCCRVCTTRRNVMLMQPIRNRSVAKSSYNYHFLSFFWHLPRPRAYLKTIILLSYSVKSWCIFSLTPIT